MDDDPLSRQVAAHLLAHDGFAAVPAANGEQAMALIETASFDAVLTDVRMPRMDGIELLKRIRARFPLLPVVLMTALIEDDVLEAACACKATALFQKPVNGADLLAALAATRGWPGVRKATRRCCPRALALRRCLGAAASGIRGILRRCASANADRPAAERNQTGQDPKGFVGATARGNQRCQRGSSRCCHNQNHYHERR